MYDSERVARGYAFDRPPVHEHILRKAGLKRVARALDVGCEAGRSKQALKRYAGQVFGLEPNAAMARWHRDFAAAGMRLESFQEFQVTIEMTLERYQRYILTETDADIGQWCAETLPRAFGAGTLDVVFDTYAVRARLDP